MRTKPEKRVFDFSALLATGIVWDPMSGENSNNHEPKRGARLLPVYRRMLMDMGMAVGDAVCCKDRGKLIRASVEEIDEEKVSALMRLRGESVLLARERLLRRIFQRGSKEFIALEEAERAAEEAAKEKKARDAEAPAHTKLEKRPEYKRGLEDLIQQGIIKGRRAAVYNNVLVDIREFSPKRGGTAIIRYQDAHKSFVVPIGALSSPED
ncbi:MAG TPA: hypothetical protein VJH69_01465 [Candidatus Paceibacterota bacterium]